jgi:hypothetical protein
LTPQPRPNTFAKQKTRPLAATTLGAPALGEASKAASKVGSKYPDLESQWKNPSAARGGIPWDPIKPMGLGQQAPLTPEYQAIFEASLQDQASGGRGNNYLSACVLAGMPRIMNLSAPMEILIQPTLIFFILENAFPRRIHTDRVDWPEDEPASFQGYSIGRWVDEDGDGRYDVLEVETRNFKGPRALDENGLPLHSDNQTIVKERIYLDKSNSDILHNEITTIDHAFTRPWTVHKTYVREHDPRWREYSCQPPAGHVFVGKDEYVLSADGKLMPVRTGQPPPDLSYFK